MLLPYWFEPTRELGAWGSSQSKSTFAKFSPTFDIQYDFVKNPNPKAQFELLSLSLSQYDLVPFAWHFGILCQKLSTGLLESRVNPLSGTKVVISLSLFFRFFCFLKPRQKIAHSQTQTCKLIQTQEAREMMAEEPPLAVYSCSLSADGGGAVKECEAMIQRSLWFNNAHRLAASTPHFGFHLHFHA